jgi:hypothetical protein
MDALPVESSQDRQIRHADMEAADYQRAIAEFRREHAAVQKKGGHPSLLAKSSDSWAVIRRFESRAKSIARARMKAARAGGKKISPAG